MQRKKMSVPKAKEFLVVTIDVECDYDGSPTWYYSNPLTFYSVTDAIPNRLQPLFNRYGAKPTYLISNVVLENDESTKVLSSLDGEYELGAHLHGDYLEPNKRIFRYDGSKNWDNQCLYDKEVEFEKMRNLTQLFRSKIGTNPSSFRAGRYSAGGNTICSLSQLGYKVDTSVTPHIIWKDKTRLLDFTKASEQPYHPDFNSITTPGDTDILEVPISIRKGIFSRNHWLRHTLSTTSKMIRVIKSYSKKYSHEDFIVHNMMFHNVEVFPKVSPYTQTEEKCYEYLERIEKVLKYCQSKGITFLTLSEVYDVYKRRSSDEGFIN